MDSGNHHQHPHSYYPPFSGSYNNNGNASEQSSHHTFGGPHNNERGPNYPFSSVNFGYPHHGQADPYGHFQPNHPGGPTSSYEDHLTVPQRQSALPPELDPDFQQPIFASPSSGFGGYPALYPDAGQHLHHQHHHHHQQQPYQFHQQHGNNDYPPQQVLPSFPKQEAATPHQFSAQAALISAGSSLPGFVDPQIASPQASSKPAGNARNRTHFLPPTFSDSEGEIEQKSTEFEAGLHQKGPIGSTNPDQSALAQPTAKKSRGRVVEEGKKASAKKITEDSQANMVATRGAGVSVNYSEQAMLPDSPRARRSTRGGGAVAMKQDEGVEAESDVSSIPSDSEEEKVAQNGAKGRQTRKNNNDCEGSSSARNQEPNKKRGAQVPNQQSMFSMRARRSTSTLSGRQQKSRQSQDKATPAGRRPRSTSSADNAINQRPVRKEPAHSTMSQSAAGSIGSRDVRTQHANTNDDRTTEGQDVTGGSQPPIPLFTDPLAFNLPRRAARVSYKEDSSEFEDEDISTPLRNTPVRSTKAPCAEAEAKRTVAATATRSTRISLRKRDVDGEWQSLDPLAGDAEDYTQEAAEASEDEDSDEDERPARKTRSGRDVKSYREVDDGSDDEVVAPTRRPRRGATSKTMGDFVVDDEDDAEESDGEYEKPATRGRLSRGRPNVAGLAAKRRKAKARQGGRRGSLLDEEDLEDADGETGEESEGSDDQGAGRSYRLRERKKVDYSLAPPPSEPQRDGFGRVIKRGRPRGGGAGDQSGGAFELDTKRAEDLGLPSIGGGRKGKTGWDALPLSMTGKDYAQAFGDDVDSSEDDIPAARKANRPQFTAGGAGGLLGGGPTPLGGGGGGASGAMGGNEGSARDAFGRVKKGGDALADVDPLGVNMQVDFNSVGGLDGHIQQLKEMVSLPLLYPEVFQRFKVTPPRGVLFHGPPGTGKTLVARALAASCSSSGQQISFFMRKGADCLSKWVGEAERQLRMLFDEARASQPSIIFFDEIDGLAPVRSSKQDQIHASIVSTLLALMDGMDGRGQVVVIGATNRPDSVDPALRRPGRFDREFYFPLPSKEGRRSIIDIHTKGWEPPLSENFKDKLAEVTKGYGGADMRALCTEAALNAIQRRYPQIYQTTERLLLQPETIQVDAKDFMMSVNKIVPSSARSASSAASPLPDFLKPILGRTVDDAIAALQKVMPPASKRNPLEEALWEDEPVGDALATGSLAASASDGGFGREMMLQSFETLRIFRPRLAIFGQPGMGQSFVGAALLHHLEGYHVQSLDIGALMGDSARTPEAAVVQLFVEAKRHKPSVIFIPGLIHWAHSVSETVRATTKALLDELSPSDPILLLAIAEGPLSDLPHDVSKWFGYLRDNKVEAKLPDESQRQSFFAELLQYITRPPTEFPDALPRRKRVLEELPKAPPRPPREPTAAELQQQAADDSRTLEHLKYRLGPVLTDLRKKFKKFTRNVWDEYNLVNLTQVYTFWKEKGKIVIRLRYEKGFLTQHRRRASSVDESLLKGAVENATMAATAEAASASANENGAPPQTNGEGDFTVTGSANGGSGSDVAMQDGSSSRLDGPLPTAQSSQGTTPHVEPALQGSSTLAGAVPLSLGEKSYSASQPVPATNGTATPHGQRVSDPPNAGAGDLEEDHVNFDYRDMPIWTMNLEKMQRHLYYNGYLTLDDFMRDLNKIVDNAEEAREVDTERLVRAHQMRNYAVVLLDQYIDPAFREECQRMAQRQVTREQAKAQAEAEAKSKAEAAAAAPRRPSGERFSARVQGQAPEHGLAVDVLAIERSNAGKRSRGSSARASADGGERKRARSALINEVDAAMENGAAGGVDGVVGTMASGDDQAQAQLQADPVGARSDGAPGTPVANGNGTSAAPLQPSDRSVIGTIGGPSTAVTTEPVVPIEHPAFNCPASLLAQLERKLLASSSTFSIDQLLQLRAACFDQVWRHRADWDRLELIGTLTGLIDEVSEAVRAEREAEGAVGA